MIKEQSCPSCTMVSTTCDKSWGPSAPGTVHHAAKQIRCLTKPWKSETANPPENVVCALLKSMTNYAPWAPQLGVHQAIQKLRKRGDQTPRPPSVFAFLWSLWHNSPSLTIRLYMQTPPSCSRCMIRHLDVCVTVAQPGLMLGRTGDASSKLLWANCSSPSAQAAEASSWQPGCSRALYFQHMDYLNS